MNNSRYIKQHLSQVHNKSFKIYVTDGSFEPLSDGFDFIDQEYQVKESLKNIFENEEIKIPRCILVGTVFCCIVPSRTTLEIQRVFTALTTIMSELGVQRAVIPQFSNKWKDIKLALDTSCVGMPVDIMICQEV